MNKHPYKSIFILFTLICTSQIFAKVASVQITTPMDGAKLISTANNKIVFDVSPGPKGDHVHLYIDNKDPIVIRQLKGEYSFKKLDIGNRNICLKLVDKNHTPVGVEKCVNVTVE